jgi:hypothetical protein
MLVGLPNTNKNHFAQTRRSDESAGVAIMIVVAEASAADKARFMVSKCGK